MVSDLTDLASQDTDAGASADTLVSDVTELATQDTLATDTVQTVADLDTTNLVDTVGDTSADVTSTIDAVTDVAPVDDGSVDPRATVEVVTDTVDELVPAEPGGDDSTGGAGSGLDELPLAGGLTDALAPVVGSVTDPLPADADGWPAGRGSAARSSSAIRATCRSSEWFRTSRTPLLRWWTA